MKATKLLVAGVAIMSAGFGLSGSVDALVSTGEVTVNGGNLVLETVPNLKFTDVDVQAIADSVSVETPLLSGTVTSPDSSNGDDSLIATVGDYRGTTSDGWTLSAELAPFVRRSGDERLLATMSLTPTPGDPSFLGYVGAAVQIGDTSTTLVTAQPGQGLGNNQFSFVADTTNKLTIPQQTVTAGVYQAEMTWTLMATPSTP